MASTTNTKNMRVDAPHVTGKKSSESNNNKNKSRVAKKLPCDPEVATSRQGSTSKTTRGGRTQRKRNTKKSTAREVLATSTSKEVMTSREDPKTRLAAISQSRIEPVTVRSTSIDLEEDACPIIPDALSAGKKKEESRSREKVKEEKKEKKAPKEKEPKEKEPKEKEPKEKEPKEKESKTFKWGGTEAATKFFANYNTIDKVKAEFKLVESLTNNKTTTAFDANTERNRDHASKIYDDNRIVLNRPGHDAVNYINASLITVKDFHHKLIVAQLPRMENESFVEDFWQMIYQEQITLVYLLVPEDILKKAMTPLFKFETGEYQYVGKMFINNRRAETDGDPKKYTIEVLPEGNSDSVMCQVHHHYLWEHLQPPPKTNRIIKMIHQFLSEKEIQSANVCVVSVLGSGRACSFIGALIAISQLNRNIEPNIGEIMTNIKHQRPGATESDVQYAGIYAIVLDYICRKWGCKTDPILKDIHKFIDELYDFPPTDSPNGK